MATTPIRIIESEDDINAALQEAMEVIQEAMEATLSALSLANLIAQKDAEEFLRTHMIQLTYPDSGTQVWLSRFFRKQEQRILIFKIASESLDL